MNVTESQWLKRVAQTPSTACICTREASQKDATYLARHAPGLDPTWLAGFEIWD